MLSTQTTVHPTINNFTPNRMTYVFCIIGTTNSRKTWREIAARMKGNDRISAQESIPCGIRCR